VKILLSRILSVFLFVANTQLIGQVPASTPTQAPLGEPSKKVRESYVEALSTIRANHVGGSRLKVDDLTTKSIDSMVHTLDPHSEFLDAKESAEFRASLNAQYFGIGATISDLSDRRLDIIGTFIRFPFKNSPAARAGLRYGDRIVEINGVSMLGKTSSETRQHLLGPRGTKVKVTVERSGRRLSFDIVRDAIPQPAIPDAYVIRPRVGYVAITQSVSSDLAEELRRTLAKLKTEGIDFLILDLRNNGGGLIVQACQVVNEFIPNGELIFQTVARRQDGSRVCVSHNAAPDETPIVALTNHLTVSAAEFIIAGLQDTDRALIVGENTFGKGLTQGTFELEGGTRLHLTVSRFQTATGRRTQRDYSGESRYRYVSQGVGFDPRVEPTNSASQPAFKTLTGRVKYGGGGITPDEIVKPETFPAELPNMQARVSSSTFAFSIELTSGRIKQFENLGIAGSLDYDHILKGDEFLINEELFQAYKQFAIENYGFQSKEIDRFHTQIARIIRNELVTAAYGIPSALRIANEFDPQVQKAFELLPRAQELWQRSKGVRAAKAKN
jgi:carboxyl-terminal processing protease